MSDIAEVRELVTRLRRERDEALAEVERLTRERDEAKALHDRLLRVSIPTLDRRVATLRAEVEPLRAVLVEIVNDGCGLRDWEQESCEERWPNDRSQWCWCCIARAALTKSEEP